MTIGLKVIEPIYGRRTTNFIVQTEHLIYYDFYLGANCSSKVTCETCTQLNQWKLDGFLCSWRIYKDSGARRCVDCPLKPSGTGWISDCKDPLELDDQAQSPEKCGKNEYLKPLHVLKRSFFTIKLISRPFL